MNILKELSGIIMALCFMLCYVPQIYKIIKTKSSRDVSLLLIVMCMVGYASGLVYMYLTTFVLWVFLNYVAGLLTSSVLILICLNYRK